MLAYLQLKHQGIHVHGLDKRDTYTIQLQTTFVTAQNKSYVTYAAKTLENLFTWCGHERYPKMI